MPWTQYPSSPFTLIDVDECLDANGGCEYTCINTNGSYTCTCSDGFHLTPNGFNCTGMSCDTNVLISSSYSKFCNNILQPALMVMCNLPMD